MVARRRLPSGWKRPRMRKAGARRGWDAGMAQALAALYGRLPAMTPAEQAQFEREAAGVPYRNPQGDLALRLPETE